MKVGKFKLRLSATLPGLLFSIAVSIQAGLAVAQQPTAKQTYVYKTAKGLDIKADVYRPAIDQVTPAIMWIHGGALIFGERSWIMAYQLDRYLAAGYTVVAIDYRLAPETKLPGILEDIQDAYGWLRKTATELRIDPTRIGIVGHSAGGYLALMAGFALDPRPPVIVAFYGYGEVAGTWYSQPDPYYLKQPLIPQAEAEATVGTTELSEAPAGNKRSTFYVYLRQQGLWPQRVTGLDPRRDGAAFDRFCPIRNVTPQYPPTLLLHGDADTDVPFQQSVDMIEALTREKIPHDIIQLHGKGHVFDRDSTDPDVMAAFNRAVEFLNARLHPAQTGANMSVLPAKPVH
jgi:acetyl esterase/lipase